MSAVGSQRTLRVRKELEEFLLGEQFACVAGRSSCRQGALEHRHYRRMAESASTEELYSDLTSFISSDRFARHFAVFLATFEGAVCDSELEFEEALWSQLQLLHDRDCLDHAWAADVDSDTSSPNFEFSVGGKAFFVVGLHPGASRTSRRFRWPALAFNAHAQFELLYATERYGAVRDTTRRRDMAIQGMLNPTLAEFGEESQARQFSGRAVPPDWRCPLVVHSGTART
jgi:uncharacterized protein